MARREQRLVKRVQQGDLRAAERLVHEHYPAVYRLHRSLTYDADEARDLTQETFVRLWRSLDQFRGDSSLSTWLHSIAFNLVLETRRKRRPTTCRWDEMDPEGAAPDSVIEEVVARAQGDRVRQALGRLDDEYRDAIVLYYLQGLSINEVADVLGVPAGTVKSRLTRARERLRKIMTEMELVGDDLRQTQCRVAS
jgi:RNA polymerase sigma-70 factor (ECF subfamily)